MNQIHRARVHESYQHVRSRRQPRLDVIVTLQNTRIGASSSIDDTVDISPRSNILSHALLNSFDNRVERAVAAHVLQLQLDILPE